MAILPYYVANLNIEATYAAITGQLRGIPQPVLRRHAGQRGPAHLGARRQRRPVRQRQRGKRRAHQAPEQPASISVIIGNPPYNANQANENDNNKNREYPHIDKRIKQTYIAESTAQKTKLYDMYARFFRWASDRLSENGVLAFVSNRSFIESRTFDGFRKTVAQEFSDIYVVDLGGDVRANPKLQRHEAQRLRHPDRRGDQLHGQARERSQGQAAGPRVLCAPAGDGDGGGEAGVSGQPSR